MNRVDPELKQRARIALVRDAHQAREDTSACEWEERALESEPGKIVGAKEIETIIRLTWGIGCRPMRGL